MEPSLSSIAAAYKGFSLISMPRSSWCENWIMPIETHNNFLAYEQNHVQDLCAPAMVPAATIRS